MARPFFTDAHRAAFHPSKHSSDSTAVNNERKTVSDRFLDLHREVLPAIKARKWDLHPHHQRQHTTSSWHLVPRYVSTIGAMWLPYGREKRHFAILSLPDEDEEQEFFNHAKMQVLLDQETVRIGLMVAQRGNAWDREYLHRKLGLERAQGVVAEPDRVVAALRAAGVSEPEARLDRTNHADPSNHEELRLREVDRERLLAFVRSDGPGNWLGIWVTFEPSANDVDEKSIAATTLRVFDHLYPVYHQLAYVPGMR